MKPKKNKKFKTFRLMNEDGTYQLIEYDPDPPPLPPGWHEQLMAKIRKIGPLRKSSLRSGGAGHSSTDGETSGSF